MDGSCSPQNGIYREPYQPSPPNDSPHSTARIQPINSQKLTCSKVIKAIGHIFLAAIGGLTYIFSFGCWSKAKEFTSKHFTLAKDLFYPSLKDKNLNTDQLDDRSDIVEDKMEEESTSQTPPIEKQISLSSASEAPNQTASAADESSITAPSDDRSKIADGKMEEEPENQAAPVEKQLSSSSAPEIPNQTASTADESSITAPSDDRSKIADGKMEEEPENQTAPIEKQLSSSSAPEIPNQTASTADDSSITARPDDRSRVAKGKKEEESKSHTARPQNVSSSSSKQKASEIDEEELKFLLDNAFNAAMDQMEAEGDKSFDYENATAGSSIKGKLFAPQKLSITDIGGSFCINPTQKNATVPISGKMKFTMANGKEHRFDLYGLFSNHLENLKIDALLVQHKQLIGRTIAKFLKIHNPQELSDLGIYKALEETLKYLQSLSKQNKSNFSTTFTVTLNEKLWVAHAGSSGAFLSNQGEPFQLSLNQFSIIDYPLKEIQPCSKLILLSGDIRKIASGKQIVKGEYEANQGFSGANNGSAARQIACAAHAAGSGQDIAVLVTKLSEIQAQNAPSTNQDTEFGKLQNGVPQPAPKLAKSKLRQALSISDLVEKDVADAPNKEEKSLKKD